MNRISYLGLDYNQLKKKNIIHYFIYSTLLSYLQTKSETHLENSFKKSRQIYKTTQYKKMRIAED